MSTLTGDYIVTALLWIAALLHLAVLRDLSIRESIATEANRWLLVGGLALLALRFTFVLSDRGHLLVPPVSLLGIALITVGAIGAAMEQLRRSHGG